MNEEDKKPTSIPVFILGLTLAILFIYAFVCLTALAWNYSIPQMFSGISTISQWTAFVFLILLAIIAGQLRPYNAYGFTQSSEDW